MNHPDGGRLPAPAAPTRARRRLAVVALAAAALLAACSVMPGTDPTPSFPTLAARAVVEPPTATPVRVPATFTPIPTLHMSPTPGPSPTPSPTGAVVAAAGATAAPPTRTLVPPRTPTSRPQIAPTIAFVGTPNPESGPLPTPPTAVPTRVDPFDIPDSVTNVLLLGSDNADLNTGQSRTDSIIIVSIDSDRQTAAMLSIPRDLYVYIPGWTMNRINTALGTGRPVAYPGGGIARLRDTIQYNFGIPIHYYARVDFDGFRALIDRLGGVELAVSCVLTDWRLKSPELDIYVEENYERFTLAPGIHQMDGHLALWYARSRLTTSDFDRGRRQQQLLRGMLDSAVEADLLTQVPALWSAYRDTVETDMDIGRMLQLATIAGGVRENGIQSLTLAGGNVIPWTVPETGASVQLPNWPVMEQTIRHLFEPSALRASNRPPIAVTIINGSGDPDMPLLAADNLAWQGFIPIIGPTLDQPVSRTSVTYFGANFKGAFAELMAWLFNQPRSALLLDSQGASTTPYQIVLGTDYDPCRPQVYAPLPEAE